jgi:hypothetical protein
MTQIKAKKGPGRLKNTYPRLVSEVLSHELVQGVHHIGLVRLSCSFQVDFLFVESQREPTLDRIYRDHPEDANVMTLRRFGGENRSAKLANMYHGVLWHRFLYARVVVFFFFAGREDAKSRLHKASTGICHLEGRNVVQNMHVNVLQ